MLNGKPHSFSHKGTTWDLSKHELPKKIRNGKFKFWLAETNDGKHGLRGDSMQDLKDQIIKFVDSQN